MKKQKPMTEERAANLPTHKQVAELDTVVAVSAGYFGFGDTVQEALDNLRKAGGGLPCWLYLGTDDIAVTDMGSIRACRFVELGELKKK